jgi:hypothetical protein
MIEKQSDYAYIVLVKFGQLVRNLVESLNALLNLIFVLLPWAAFAGIVYLAARLIKKKK